MIILIILANIRAGFICLRVLNLSVVIIPTHYPQPCPAYHEAELNHVEERYIDDVDLSPIGASEQQIEEAYKAMAGSDGIIVAGIHKTRLGPYGKIQVLVGSQFYLRFLPNPCQSTGCSGQICAETAVMTTCEWRAEYACYQTAVCKQQANGQCGWTETPELLECLDNARN
ncbi:hypothetical protein C2W62_38395 [Candidatus Entotheonella serta]|nr:hypothetical protein C2W62_38395 [Candidatus Entotheonella serta]